MFRSRRKRPFLVMSACPLVLAGVPVWLVARAYRQTQLDHELIAAIRKDDTPGILTALNAGADANAFADNDTAPSFRSILIDFWDRVVHKKPNAPKEFRPRALWLVVTRHGPMNPFDPGEVPDNPIAVRALLDHGADVHYGEKEGRSVLVAAAQPKQWKTARLLVERGANVNARNEEGMSALHLASSMSRLDMVRLLLEHGAQVNVKDNDSMMPLHYASYLDQVAITKLLLEHGADVNAQDDEGQTALMICGWGRNVAMARLLLAHGARRDLKDKNEYTALSWARKIGDKEMARLLR